MLLLCLLCQSEVSELVLAAISVPVTASVKVRVSELVLAAINVPVNASVKVSVSELVLAAISVPVTASVKVSVSELVLVTTAVAGVTNRVLHVAPKLPIRRMSASSPPVPASMITASRSVASKVVSVALLTVIVWSEFGPTVVVAVAKVTMVDCSTPAALVITALAANRSVAPVAQSRIRVQSPA